VVRLGTGTVIRDSIKGTLCIYVLVEAHVYNVEESGNILCGAECNHSTTVSAVMFRILIHTES
jgi:hypothetical protein